MENKITTGTVQELMNRVSNSLGKKPTAEDVAVVGVEQQLSGQFDVSKKNIIDFLSQVEPMLRSGDVAIITAEDMQENKSKKDNKPKLR